MQPMVAHIAVLVSSELTFAGPSSRMPSSGLLSLLVTGNSVASTLRIPSYPVLSFGALTSATPTSIAPLSLTLTSRTRTCQASETLHNVSWMVPALTVHLGFQAAGGGDVS